MRANFAGLQPKDSSRVQLRQVPTHFHDEARSLFNEIEQ
jgi:hypothetical protein